MGQVSETATRKHHGARRAFIAFGANLGDPYGTFRRALHGLARSGANPIGEIISVSRAYETAPLVLPGRSADGVPPYLNAVVEIQSLLTPEQILTGLFALEAELGRDRTVEVERWMPRVVDLDLIAVEDCVLQSDFLVLPHKEMHLRDFVLRPMSELAPDWRHPKTGETVREMLKNLSLVED